MSDVICSKFHIYCTVIFGVFVKPMEDISAMLPLSLVESYCYSLLVFCLSVLLPLFINYWLIFLPGLLWGQI